MCFPPSKAKNKSNNIKRHHLHVLEDEKMRVKASEPIPFGEAESGRHIRPNG